MTSFCRLFLLYTYTPILLLTQPTALLFLLYSDFGTGVGRGFSVLLMDIFFLLFDGLFVLRQHSLYLEIFLYGSVQQHSLSCKIVGSPSFYLRGRFSFVFATAAGHLFCFFSPSTMAFCSSDLL